MADRSALAGDPAGEAQLATLTELMQVEAEARRARAPEEFAYAVVNQTRRVVDYAQAVLVRRTGPTDLAVVAVSGVAVLDRAAPFQQWISRVLRRLASGPRLAEMHALDPAELDDDAQRDRADLSPPQILWCPLVAPDGTVLGGLWLAREAPWRDGERVLLDRLAESYAHAWAALLGRRATAPRRRWGRVAALLAALAAAAAMFLPVRQSVLAPAEVVARDASVVSAPLAGVVERFLVEPNSPVAAGDPLFSFEEDALRSEFEVADRALAVAQAEYRRASQGAFRDADSKAQIAVLQAQIRLREAERAYAKTRLDRITVTSPADGIAVFADPNEWIGRPVQIGERVLEIADPARAAIRVHLPTEDAIALETGAEVELFLDVRPLEPLAGLLTYASYEPTVRPDGVLAYRVDADFAPGVAPPRIGLQGTAKLFGARVSLFFYLFRRPISALRQTVGF